MMTGISSRVSAIGISNQTEIYRLNQLLQRTDISTVVIVPSHTLVDQARVLFPGASIYTVEESKGLEFDVVIKYGFYNSDDTLLKEVDGVYRNGGYSSSPQNRSKERNSLARSNSLYFHKSFVAATRTMSELIIVDDVVASDSFPSLWEALKGELSISHEISASEQSSSDFSQLPANEQISTLSAKIVEFAIRIKDDIARGITRNVAAHERNMGALIQQREFIVEEVMDAADTETLWSIVGLSEALNSGMMRRIAANPNANIEILEQMLRYINDVSIFDQLLARVDIFTTDEVRVDFMTSLLRCMLQTEKVLEVKSSFDEAFIFRDAIERIKAELNSLFAELTGRDDLVGVGVISNVLLKITVNEFANTGTLNVLAGRCLFAGQVNVVAAICGHENADFITIEMASHHLQIQQSSEVNHSLLRAIILSPHANEGVILSLIANIKTDIELGQITIQQSRWKSNLNVISALVRAKRSQAVKKSNTKSVQVKAATNKERGKGSECDVSDVQAKLATTILARKERGEQLIEGHARKITDFFSKNRKNKFMLSHHYLTKKAMIKFAIRVVLASRVVLNHYLESRDGRRELERLLQGIGSDNLSGISDVEKEIVMGALKGGNILECATSEKLKFVPIFLGSCIGSANISSHINDVDVVRFMHQRLPDNQAKNLIDCGLSSTTSTPLYSACRDGNKELVTFLLSVDVDCMACNDNGANSAHALVATGDFKILKLLIKSLPNDGARNKFVNKQMAEGIVPLHIAAMKDDESVVKVLLLAGADCMICEENGLSSMDMAAKSGSLKSIKLFVESLPDHESRSKLVNAQSASVSGSPLHIACQDNHVAVARYLLSVGADYNFHGPYGFGPIHAAARKGSLEAIKLLVEIFPGNIISSEFVNRQTVDGITPIYYACQGDHADVVEYLLSVGADCSISPDDGLGVMHIASQNGNLEVVKLLVENHNDSSISSNLLNMQWSDGATALFLACQNGHFNVVEYLLNCTSVLLRPIIRTYDEFIEFGIENGESATRRIKEKLLSKSGFVGCENKIAIFPFEIAVIMGHSAIAELLSVYMKENTNEVDRQTIETEFELNMYRDFNTMLYSSRLHRTFQGAYESGQREDAGYGGEAMVVYNLGRVGNHGI